MQLKNCRLIPRLSDGADFALADIDIADGKIAAVRPASGAPTQEGDVDCAGRTVLPGLFDLHVHLVNERAPNDIYHAFELYNQYAPTLGVFLDWGVTAVRDCGSTMSLACRLREGGKGFFEGPRILSSGQIISPEAMRRKGEGASTPLPTALTRSCARRGGSYVASYAHSTDAINTCIRCGVRSIEHTTYLDDESIRLLLSTPDVYTVPTSAVAEPYLDGDGYNDPATLRYWSTPYMVESSRHCRGREKQAYLAGVKMGLGTDLSPADFVKYPYEFRVRKHSCGMDNVDILLQATKVSAEIAQLGGVAGEVREGYAADLTAVDGRPDEDISVMYRRPALVIKRGEIKRRA